MNYEARQRQAIAVWAGRSPAGWVSWMSAGLTPVSRLLEAVIPPSAIQAGLEAACGLGEKLASPRGILAQTGLESVSSLRDSPLELCDGLADKVHDRAIALAAAEGGVTGATGLAGLALDIPGLMTLSLRTIYQMGLCYGFELKGEEGRRLALQILSLAGADSLQEKEAALMGLAAVRRMLLNQSWSQIEQAAGAVMGREALVVVLRDVSRQLWISLTRRKALNLVPVVGGAVGAAINAGFVKDVGWAARRTFQQMWLEGRPFPPVMGTSGI